MKRSLFFFLVLICAASLVFATGGNQNQASGKIPVRYYMPGGPAYDINVVVAAINDALARDGLNLEYQPNYIGWDQWWNRTQIMLSTGEEFELLHIMQDGTPASTYASRNHLKGLSAIIRQHAPNLTGRFDQVLWDSATINGEIYAIPAYWRDASGGFEGVVTIRKDMFDRFGLAYPRTTQEILSTLPVLQERWRALDGMNRYVYEHTPNRPPTALHRTYDTWPFYVSGDGVFMVRQNGTAGLYYESDEFRRDAEFMNALYTRGLIHPDTLNLPNDTKNTTIYDNGDFLLNLMTGPQWTSQLTWQNQNVSQTAEVLRYSMNADKPYLAFMPLLNCNGVPLAAKNPEAGVKFLDWLYSRQANHDLLMFGIQGRHWNPNGQTYFSYIRNAEGSPIYNFGDSWMMGYAPFTRWETGPDIPQEAIDSIAKNIFPNQTVISPVVGFNFNSEPVRVEMANVLAEYTASILPIKVGVLPYAGNYQAALARMKAAGSDALIAEYSRQLTAYIRSR